MHVFPQARPTLQILQHFFSGVWGARSSDPEYSRGSGPPLSSIELLEVVEVRTSIVE